MEFLETLESQLNNDYLALKKTKKETTDHNYHDDGRQYEAVAAPPDDPPNMSIALIFDRVGYLDGRFDLADD